MVSRDIVQVVLRDSTSMSPDCSAVKRLAAVSGTNLTLVGSLKIAAAMARQNSTSKPVQLPCAVGHTKPGKRSVSAAYKLPAILDRFQGLRACSLHSKRDHRCKGKYRS
jgi:hypothetical protein